jgi:hypothetical protein
MYYMAIKYIGAYNEKAIIVHRQGFLHYIVKASSQG